MKSQFLKKIIAETIQNEFEIIFESFKDAQRLFSQENRNPELVAKTIEQFRQLKKQNRIQNSHDKDISYWIKKGWEPFFTFVNQLQNKKSRKQIKNQESLRVFEDEQYLIIIPLSKEASILYGKGTKWCTSAAQSTNFFRDYFLRQKATLFYIVNKLNNDKFVAVYYTPKDKFQLVDAEHNFIAEQDFPFSPNFFRGLYDKYKNLIEQERNKQAPQKKYRDTPNVLPKTTFQKQPIRRRRIINM